MPAVFEYQHQVRDEEIDSLGHVTNLAYMRWMQDAAVAHSTAQGWPLRRHVELGAGWVVRSHAITYLRPAFAGEQVVVRTWVAGFKKTTSLRKYRIIRPDDDALLAIAETNWAFIGFERWAPRRIPQEVREAFELVTEESEP
jgi:acyl-CoA thioester hydrolase